MMTAEMIIERLRQRAGELQQSAEATMARIGMISKSEETEDQRRLRNAAQSDFDTAMVLEKLVEEIEQS
jgi:hypothetical protein